MILDKKLSQGVEIDADSFLLDRYAKSRDIVHYLISFKEL